MKNKVLIIDDEPSICSSLTFALEDKYEVNSVTNPMDGLKLLIKNHYNVVLLDLKIGNIDGINILQEIKNIDKSIQVIIMTAFGSILSSVDAVKKGAYTYLTKPLNLNELDDAIQKSIEHQMKNEKVEYENLFIKEKHVFNGIIGKSPAMKVIFNLIQKLKDVDTSVVITGESGTGKEMIASALHYAGKRKNGNFVAFNCAAIPETLLEEELFGHKKGTFTGAISDKEGKLEYANNGTIFLDEIGDMALSLQAKLLRVIQQKEYTPLGGNKPVQINIRFIAATNKDLKKLVQEGKFREDLYFRLNVFEINLPPLRQRRQDLPLLIKHFIKICNEELSKNIAGLSREAENLLLNYNYPGNIRELRNIIEHAVLLSNDEIIKSDNLPFEVRNKYDNHEKEEIINFDVLTSVDNLAGLPLQEAEKKLIKAALKLNNGQKKATALMLGISERGLRNKINEYNIN